MGIKKGQGQGYTCIICVEEDVEEKNVLGEPSKQVDKGEIMISLAEWVQPAKYTQGSSIPTIYVKYPNDQIIAVAETDLEGS